MSLSLDMSLDNGTEKRSLMDNACRSIMCSAIICALVGDKHFMAHVHDIMMLEFNLRIQFQRAPLSRLF